MTHRFERHPTEQETEAAAPEGDKKYPAIPIAVGAIHALSLFEMNALESGGIGTAKREIAIN